MARAYDKGTPRPAVRLPDGTWSIDSFRGETSAYRVDLAAGTCTCPHFTGRLAGTGQECKHLQSVRQQSHFLALLEKARLLTDAQIAALLPRYTERGRADVAGALRIARAERRQAEAARPMVGASTKTWGPTTDAEAQTWMRAA